jgi:hypothetical protein
VADRVAAIASGIKKLGLVAKDKVAVLGVNCPDWMITMQVGGEGRGGEGKVCGAHWGAGRAFYRGVSKLGAAANLPA